MNWAYGVTTIPERRDTLLPRTLNSLREAGFDNPRLFVDGDDDPRAWKSRFNLAVTCRDRLRTFGNWVLAMGELYIRHPTAERYALFQDDFVSYKNVRQYLETTPYPENGYLNLYTFPSNFRICPRYNNRMPHVGWYESNQLGKGAVGLVFSRPALVELLKHPHMVKKPQDPERGWRNLDGAILEAMKHAGYKEYVHNPSLVQHTGRLSSIRDPKRPAQPLAPNWRGEAFDAMTLHREIELQRGK